eukprot:3895016-Prymnesium_polylepis.1
MQSSLLISKETKRWGAEEQIHIDHTIHKHGATINGPCGLRSGFGCTLYLVYFAVNGWEGFCSSFDPRSLSSVVPRAHHKWGGRVIRWKYP